MTNAKTLFTLGDDWRTEIPGLWAILRGRGSEVRIAQLLGWPIHRVRAEMTQLENIEIVKRSTTGLWILNREHDNYETHVAVRKLYQGIDRRLSEEFPTQVQIEELSSIVRDEAKAAKKAAKGQGPEPTEVQLRMLTVVYKAFGKTPFTPLAMGKAQGYTQAGWSKKYLETLSRKGFVEQVEAERRGSHWRLTLAGVEWATK